MANTKHYIASVKDENNNIKILESSDYSSKKAFATDIRGNGYKVRFIATAETFDDECEKYHARVDKQTSIRKYAREAMNATPTTEILSKEEFEQRVGMTYDELETTIAEEHQTKANYDGIEYPEKEDCKDCISRHDCKHKLTFQFNEKCELKQPVELYVDTEILKLSDIRATLETLFERLDTFKASYRWKIDIDSYEKRELKSKEYTIPEQEFSAFGDRYTIEFKIDYRRSSVHKDAYYTKNGKRVTLATITALYKRICKRISEISDVE